MIGELKEIILHFAADVKNNTLQNRYIGMAVILFFSLMLLAAYLLRGIYLFDWISWEGYSFFTGAKVRGYYLYWMGTIALLLLLFGKRCAACGVMLGNAIGLIAGHFLGGMHYAAQLAKITPDMDEGAIGALMCCAHNGAFIWLYTSLAFLAAGLLADWFLQRRARKIGADAPKTS